MTSPMLDLYLTCLSLLILFGLSLGSLLTGNTYDSLYSNVQPANLSESYDRIKRIPLRHFELVHDSVPGRRHMGVIGPDAQKHFPESVEVVPTYSIPNKDRKQPPTTLFNYPLVDKSVIFMHGLAAIQELIRLQESLEESVSSMLKIRKEYEIMFADIERRLSMEVSSQLIEQKSLVQQEILLAKKTLELDTVRALMEKEAIEVEVRDERALLMYKEELSRNRMIQQDHLAHMSMERTLLLERQLAEKREIFRMNTANTLEKRKVEYSTTLEEKKKEFEMEKIRAELSARMEEEKMKENVAIKKMQTQAKLDTQRHLDLIRSILQQIAILTKDFFSDTERLTYTVCSLLALMLLYYSIKELISVVRDFVKARLGRPSLVRETSVHTVFFMMFSAMLRIPEFVTGENSTKKRKSVLEHFQNVLLCDEDKHRVVQLALATMNTRRSGNSYRHLLLHGPPGTGKTLLARHLAECSGMDYAIMSGGDVGPLGEDAVTQLHGLFRWAKRSRRGLLLFVDEAEAFLCDRGQTVQGADGTHVRNALNALLYQTGTESKSFMMVLASNRPEDLDRAVLDRIDVSMYVGLPALKERESMVRLYCEKELVRVALDSQRRLWPFSKRMYVDEKCCTALSLDAVAMQCKGFSGREIAKLFISCRYTMVMAEKGLMTMELFQESVQNKVLEHQKKILFSSPRDELPGTEITPENHSPLKRQIESDVLLVADTQQDKVLIPRGY